MQPITTTHLGSEYPPFKLSTSRPSHAPPFAIKNHQQPQSLVTSRALKAPQVPNRTGRRKAPITKLGIHTASMKLLSNLVTQCKSDKTKPSSCARTVRGGKTPISFGYNFFYFLVFLKISMTPCSLQVQRLFWCQMDCTSRYRNPNIKSWGKRSKVKIIGITRKECKDSVSEASLLGSQCRKENA